MTQSVTTATPTAQVREQRTLSQGPVPLSAEQLKLVGGGSPKGGWLAASTDTVSSPKGGWQ